MICVYGGTSHRVERERKAMQDPPPTKPTLPPPSLTNTTKQQREKLRSADFGRCPRAFCGMQAVLPVGLSDTPRVATVNVRLCVVVHACGVFVQSSCAVPYPSKSHTIIPPKHKNNITQVFCPRCQDVYVPRSARQAALDGAYFGSTFPHLLLMTHPECIPPKPERAYVPRVYGFRIAGESQYYRRRERGSGSGGGRGGGEGAGSVVVEEGVGGKGGRQGLQGQQAQGQGGASRIGTAVAVPAGGAVPAKGGSGGGGGEMNGEARGGRR